MMGWIVVFPWHMNTTPDIEDINTPDPEFSLTKEQTSQLHSQLKAEGYRFSENGIRRLASEIESADLSAV